MKVHYDDLLTNFAVKFNLRRCSRGLNTLVFVPWEDVQDHILNLGVKDMDFFVTG